MSEERETEQVGLDKELEKDLGLERHPLADTPPGGSTPAPSEETVSGEDWSDEDERRLAKKEE